MSASPAGLVYVRIPDHVQKWFVPSSEFRDWKRGWEEIALSLRLVLAHVEDAELLRELRTIEQNEQPVQLSCVSNWYMRVNTIKKSEVFHRWLVDLHSVQKRYPRSIPDENDWRDLQR
jgi:hypothetical protein